MPLIQLQLDIEHHLAAIERMFKPDSVRITLVIRNIKWVNADVVMTMDDPEKAIQVIRERFNMGKEG